MDMLNRNIFPSPEPQFPPSSKKSVFLFPISPPPPLPSTTVEYSSSDPLALFLSCAIVFVIALICISFIVIFVLLPLFNHNNIIPGHDPSIINNLSIRSDHHSVEENRDRGVDPSLIRALPEFKFKLGKNGSVNCAICLSEFECKEVVKKIPFCGHVFHPKCIEMWLLDHPSCPLCRSVQLFPQPVHTFNGFALLKGWLKLT